MSSDGKSVYVTSPSANSVAHFFRNGPQGQIGYDGCLANDASQGCANVPAAPLTGARGVAVSPDGRSVYVVAASGSITHFLRNGPDGQIAFDNCLANDDTQACTDLPFAPLTALPE